MTGKQYREAIVPGAISYALKIGRLLRQAKENGSDAASGNRIRDGWRSSVQRNGNRYSVGTADGFQFRDICL